METCFSAWHLSRSGGVSAGLQACALFGGALIWTGSQAAKETLDGWGDFAGFAL
jgi:hypothetical protein